MDFANLVPQIAAAVGISPSTLLLLVFLTNVSSNVIARRIPDDATGWLGFIRKVAAFLGAHVKSVLTSDGVTINDVARAALTTPPISRKAAQEAKS